MSTKQGYIKDFENNKMIPETTSAMVTDLAKNQALSQTLHDTPDKDALGYDAFSTVTDYAKGDKVYYNNKLYEFTTAHAAGAWTGEDVEEFNIKDFIDELSESKANKDGYYVGMAAGLADNLRGDTVVTEQFLVRTTGGENNEVGQIGVLQGLQGAGATSCQYYPEGADHLFATDADLTDAPVRYIDYGNTVETGYLMTMEYFDGVQLDQTALDAIAAKDANKGDGDKCVWLTEAGAVLAQAPTIDEGESSVTFSGWRIAMRVKASEVRDHSGSAYWYTAGTKGRQAFDVVMDCGFTGVNTFILADGWGTKSAMEYLVFRSQRGLPTHQCKAGSVLLGVEKIGFKTVRSRNLLNPTTGKAFVTTYLNDADGFVNNELTVVGGLPENTTLSFQSLLTGKTEAIEMIDTTHFAVPGSGWVIVNGTLPSAIIYTYDGTKDSLPADTYETESHEWQVSGFRGKLNGEGESVQIGTMLRGVTSSPVRDEIDLAKAECYVRLKLVTNFNPSSVTNYTAGYYGARLGTNHTALYVLTDKYGRLIVGNTSRIANAMPMAVVRNDQYANFLLARCNSVDEYRAIANGINFFQELPDNSKLHYTDLTYIDPHTGIEQALSELQFADNNWSVEEAVYDAPTVDSNGVQTPQSVTGVIGPVSYSMDAVEEIKTLKDRVTALEEAIAQMQ